MRSSEGEAAETADAAGQDSKPSTSNSADGADGSAIADKYAKGEWMHSKGQVIPERYPTNREVATAVEQQVSASVETYRSYRHVAWYTTFVALYLLALYYQVC